MKSALVIGASGLVGRQLVFELLKQIEYQKVKVLVRKDLVIEHPKLQQIICNFDQLSSYSEAFEVDDLFICIGTTRSKTPDLTTYKKIDQEIPVDVAHLARKAGCKQVLFVSSMGADVKSSIFYSRLKGETENLLSAIGFESCHHIRPGLLLGERNEYRPAEAFFQLLMTGLNYLFLGPLRGFKAIEGARVAKAMVQIANMGLNGVHFWDNKKLLDLAPAAKLDLRYK